MSDGGIFHGGPKRDSLRNFFAGSVSGFLCKIIEYPLDTVKVIQQTAPPGRYTGPIDVAVSTVRDNGFRSLYQGLATPLLGSILENAFVFSAYKRFQVLLGMEDNVWSSRTAYGMCGAGGGVVASLVLTPAELIKCKLQILQSKKKAGSIVPGPWQMTQQILQTEGLRGMYRGHLATMSREIPGNFAWFFVYEAILRACCDRFGYENREAVPLAMKSAAGSVSGMCYWAFPFPFDTAKSLIQTDPRFRGKSIPFTLSKVLEEQGVKGLYKGLPVTLVRAAPSHALIFFSFELVDETLKRW